MSNCFHAIAVPVNCQPKTIAVPEKEPIKVVTKIQRGEKGEKGDQGDKGDQGIQGEKGDQGDPGAGVQSFVFTQTSTLATWTIPHNLGLLYPNIQVFDDSGETIVGQVEALDINNLLFKIIIPYTGVAYLNG